eukprot:CAMPEP_0172448812 /NCGR_PEP_ID=MMETSP1065-20121228/7748_1 /TAXON_ID=265537 /ORGANISM="Amphiprora paludosa, Strain CCMP125" /LENGTH=225 /DNA_ID=CAMNT_0013200401 /DNA_START=17 /DNA_END=694 /DNA_ORIENTATION=-
MSSKNNGSANVDDVMEAAKMAQQAKQAMGQVNDAIPDQAKSALQSAKERIFDSDQLRSLTVFCGFGEGGSAFSVALNPTVLCPRLKNNLVFFYLNYILVTAIVFCIVLLATMLNPVSLIFLVALAFGWFVVLRATADGSTQVGPLTITRKVASGIMVVISVILAFFLVKDIFFVTMGSGAALSLLHAFFRDASQHYNTADSSTQSPLVDGEDADYEKPDASYVFP